MTLHVTRVGQGPTLVLLHGWGLHSGVWKELTNSLAGEFTLTMIDLPGHGRSHVAPMSTQLTEVSEMLVEQISGPAIWLGWSLGGLIALETARRFPERVSGLVLVSSTPRFVQQEDWPSAMPRAVFRDFADNLAKDYRATVLRFLSLQSTTDEAGRQLIKRLRSEIFVHGEPAPQSLANGLALLENSDLRDSAATITTPALVIHGQHDRLAPPAAGQWLARTLPNARWELIGGAGHAPFLSHPQHFATIVRSVLS